MISHEALKKFKSIWKKQYGEDLDDKTALEYATHLLVLFNAIYRPLRKEWLKGNEEN